MKGFEEYAQKHGNHFTEELAEKAIDLKWGADKIKKVAENKVYYNVTDSSFGDIVFLTNLMSSVSSLSRAVDYALSVIGNYYCTEKPFLIWVNKIAKKEDFDFTPYI